MSKTLGNILRYVGTAAVFVTAGPQAAYAFYQGTGAIASALQGAPKSQVPTTSLKSPTPPRVSAYGRVRLYWIWILYETASDGWAVDVGVFHDGQLDGIEQHYIGDKKVTVLAGGWIQKGPAGEWGNDDSVRIGTRLGLSVETAFSEVVAKLPGIWTSNHRGDGCATGFMLSKNVKTENFQTVYATGGPNNAQLSIVARAQRVFDWRDPTQSVDDPSTWKWSENVWLHIAHFELVRVGKQPSLPPYDPGYDAELAALLQQRWDRKIAPTLTYWTAAADDADIAMTLKAGGTEPRYRSCVSYQHSDAYKVIRGALLGCCDGWMATRSDRALVVYSGRYYEPTVTIGPDDIISFSLQEGVDEEDAANTLKVTYVSADHDFSVVDTDDWVDEDDIVERGKVLNGDPIAFETPSHAQNRRLAKRALGETMAPQRGVTSTRASGRIAVGQRYVRQQLVEAGTTFQDAVVQIKKLRRNPQTGGVTYEWILADPNIDDWDALTEEGDPAPVGDRVAPEPLERPVVASAIFIGSENSGQGTQGARVEIHATGPNRDDLTWRARWRSDGGNWSGDLEYSDADPGPAVELITDFVPVSAEIDVQVRYIAGDGRYSEWSLAVTVGTGSITFDSTTWSFDSTAITFDRT